MKTSIYLETTTSLVVPKGQISRSSFQTGDDIDPRVPIVPWRWQLAWAGSNTESRTMQWGWSQHPMLVCFLLLLQFIVPSSPSVSTAALPATGHSPTHEWLLACGSLHPQQLENLHQRALSVWKESHPTSLEIRAIRCHPCNCQG